MNRNSLVILAIVLSTSFTNAQIGQFEEALDIGNPDVKGSSLYDEASQTYTLKGGGTNIWFNHDEFHFLFKKIRGDFIATANFELIGNEDGNGHRKTGWMIRENTEHDAKGVNTCLHGDGLVVMQWRLMRGAYMRDPEEEIFFPKQYFGENIIQLERKGDYITMRMAHPGEPLEEISSAYFPELNKDLLIGLYSLAHDAEDIQEAKIWNVRISVPVDPDWHPNRLVNTISHEGLELGSRVEILDLMSGYRKVVYESDDRINSASFDSHADVLFEKGEKIYKVSVSGGEVNEVTKAVPLEQTNSNGSYSYYTKGKNSTNQIWRKKGDIETQMTHDLDHAWNPHLSRDGKHIAYLSMPNMSNPVELVSYQKAAIKILPTDGGAAKTVAYIYGGKGSFDKYPWSLDGKFLVFISNSSD